MKTFKVFGTRFKTKLEAVTTAKAWHEETRLPMEYMHKIFIEYNSWQLKDDKEPTEFWSISYNTVSTENEDLKTSSLWMECFITPYQEDLENMHRYVDCITLKEEAY